MRSKNNNSISNRFISHLIVSTVHSHTGKTTSSSTQDTEVRAGGGNTNLGNMETSAYAFSIYILVLF